MRTQFKNSGPSVSAMARLLTAVFLFSFVLSALSRNETYAADSCQSIFSAIQKAEDKLGAAFIHERDSKLHTSSAVEKSVKQNQRITGVNLSKPADKLDYWLSRLNKVAYKASSSPLTNSQVKEILYKQFVMKPSEVPESYYNQQVRIALERGHGHVKLSEAQRADLAVNVIKDQQRSMDVWVDYLVSKDTQIYPMWLKYWMFTGMMKLSKFEGESGTFGNRSKETVAPFVEVNHEALSYVADMAIRKVHKKSLDDIQDPALLKALEGVNFGKLYGQALFKLGVGRDGAFATNEGRWVRYERGADHMPLVKSLEGRNTGWCTAGEATAQRQLRDGDFYVYYSRDKNGEEVLPRVAIRMEGDKIGEVRGVAKDQNLDSQIASSNVVSDKMKTFGSGGEKFLRRDQDMKLLTSIDKKFRLNQELTKEEVSFVREFERPIDGFGNQRDPRIAEILAARDVKQDYAILFDHLYTKDEIALTAREYLTAETKFKVIIGDLVITDPNQKMPQIIMGSLSVIHGENIDGWVFPKHVGKDLILTSVESARRVRLPEEVGGDLRMPYARNVEGMILPAIVRGDFEFGNLKSAKDFKMPKEVRNYRGPQDIQK